MYIGVLYIYVSSTSSHHTKQFIVNISPMVSCLPPCSAGVGRTGTFITIDAMMERLKEKDDLNIYQFVTEMRSRRTFMVQTMVSVYKII